MKSISFILLLFIALSPISSLNAHAEEQKIIALPDPKNQILRYNDSLSRALTLRASAKEFNTFPLDIRDISALLWSASGVNREDGKLTIPTMYNRQDTSIIMIDDKGIWDYIPSTHSIEFRGELPADILSKLGGEHAPVTFVYTFNAGKGNTIESGYMQVGSMYQNASLYAAIADINNVVKLSFAADLSDALMLPRNIEILIVQSFGRQ